jgi:hypothetical protein
LFFNAEEMEIRQLREIFSRNTDGFNVDILRFQRESVRDPQGNGIHSTVPPVWLQWNPPINLRSMGVTD